MERGEGAKRTGPALESMYRFVLWLVPTVEKFPRRQKFLLGDRLQATALDVLERLIEATYTRDRRPHLAAANLGLEKLRFLCRLATDLRHLDMKRYAHAARTLDETGRLIRGWRRPTMPRRRDGLIDPIAVIFLNVSGPPAGLCTGRSEHQIADNFPGRRGRCVCGFRLLVLLVRLSHIAALFTPFTRRALQSRGAPAALRGVDPSLRLTGFAPRLSSRSAVRPARFLARFPGRVSR